MECVGTPTEGRPRPRRPRPIGFPGCRHCAFRAAERPDVCLACFEAGQRAGDRRPCPICGQATAGTGICPNQWCARMDRAFSVAYTIGPYEAGLRKAIVGYKFRGERWWAAVFARLLAGYLHRHATWFEEYDVLIGMPAYAGPGARRAWDPIGGILAELGPLVDPGWTIAAGLVVKTAETEPMSVRARLARLTTAEGPLRRSLIVPDAGRVRAARVLVIDDVLTEGSSLREVARVLRRAGADEVAGLVLARRPWVHTR